MRGSMTSLWCIPYNKKLVVAVGCQLVSIADVMAFTTCSWVLAITVAATVAAAPQGEGVVDLPAKVKLEESCSRAGGICLPEGECPTGQLSPKRGLCPLQQDAGIECCHGLSILERRCSKRGGECTLKTRCGRQLWDDHAQDCSQNEACCVLVE